jgi:steroid delta-isomerase-like uncharacterized protein
MTRGTQIVKFAGPAVAVMVLALVLGCQPRPAGGISVEEATAFADRLAVMWNEGNLDLLGELYAPEIVWHHAGIVEDTVGLDAAREFGTQVLAGFPDLHVVVDEVLVAGDRVILRWTETGTNTGPWGGQPPTGKWFEITGVAIYQLADGKVVKEWDYFNELTLWQQLGYTLAPPAEEAAE